MGRKGGTEAKTLLVFGEGAPGAAGKGLEQFFELLQSNQGGQVLVKILGQLEGYDQVLRVVYVSSPTALYNHLHAGRVCLCVVLKAELMPLAAAVIGYLGAKLDSCTRVPPVIFHTDVFEPVLDLVYLSTVTWAYTVKDLIATMLQELQAQGLWELFQVD